MKKPATLTLLIVHIYVYIYIYILYFIFFQIFPSRQVNFSSRIITTVERGTIKRRLNFDEVMRVETDEGMKVLVFVARGKELEFDADTLEEKNKVQICLEFNFT